MTRSRANRPYRVVAHGLTYFCQKLPGLLQDSEWSVLDRSGHSPGQMFELVRDLAKCDLAYTWGGRVSMGKFLWAARILRKKKIVMLWSGSDVLFAQREHAAGGVAPWIREKVHWANAPWVAKEVREMGLACEYVPQVHFVKVVDNPKPFPEKFSVLIFVRDAKKAELYGWDRMVEVARELPQIEFNLCGLPEDQTLEGPPNIKIHHWISDLKPLLEETTVVYRPIRHDGISFTVLEALAQGRHVLWSYPLEGCVQVTGTAAARDELAKLQAAHQSGTLPLNEKGMRYVKTHHAFEVARPELLRRWGKIIQS